MAQWIKASERLPDDRVAAKYGHHYGELVPNHGYVQFDARGTQVTLKYDNPGLADILWLDESSPASPEIERLKDALGKIMEWKLPETGKYWGLDQKEPMSYGAAWGSNGERDYFKHLAYCALANIPFKDPYDFTKTDNNL